MMGSLVDGLMGGSMKSYHYLRRKRRGNLVAAVAMVSLFLACEAQATTYYVDKATGSDSRAGTSVSTAWATIGKANATLRAGDTVYVRAGTYYEIIEPYQSGAAGAPITYQNYPGEAPMIRGESGLPYIVVIGVGVHSSWAAKSYIIVDGFTIRHIDPFHISTGERPTLVFINGASSYYNVIRNCTIQAQGSPTWGGGIEDAILIYSAKHTTIESNHISGIPRIGVLTGGIPQYTTIRGNQILNTSRSNIDISSGQRVMQYTLIENNIIDTSYIEDGIQCENDYSLPAGTTDYDSNRGIIVRNNIIANSAENCLDLKGGAYLVIEGNIMYGCPGMNNGGLDPSEGLVRYPGAGTIMHGANTGSRNVILRRNVLYDGPGGILPEDYYKIYNNVIIYNNHDYTGSNSNWVSPSFIWPSFTGINAIENKTGLSIKNNIIGGHNGSDFTLGRGATAADIDYNLYFNDSGALLVDYRGRYDWSMVPFSQWSSFLASLGVPGSDAHSQQAAPLFVNVPADLTGSHTKFDFHLRAGSPAIDRGGFLTTTTSAGQGTSIPVKDATYFCDGFGIVEGDTIQLQGQSVTARITAINSNTLVVDKALTWSAGQGVALAYQGSAPDVGAFEYGSGSTPTTYTLTINATNGTVTKSPNQTSYTSGQTVTLQATPNTGYTFSGWSGDLTGTTNPATLVMNGNKTVTANFTAVPATYALTVNATNGTVTKSPNQTSYTSGQTVTLQATPNTGYTFSGWSGDLTGTTNPATLVMNANKSVTATFTAPSGGTSYALTISATNGSVTKSPNQTSYTSGQTVTLQATPNTGYTFSGWSGDLTGSANPATLVMNANKSVVANFTSAGPATVYYVDRAAGNDNNDGKSPTTAWQSISKINSYAGFVPGDQILLHRGHVWREQLTVPASGTAGHPIVIGAYDTGNRPLLKGSVWMTSWTSAGANLWQASLGTQPNQVFFSGTRGTMQASLAALTGAQQWYWAAGVLYVYATSDPSSIATPIIEASIRPTTRTSGLIHVQDRSYVTVQDLEVTQSYSAGICLASSGQGLTVQNCEADNSLDGGVVATSSNVALSNVTVDGCLIHHNNGGVKEGALGVATYHEGLTLEGVNGFTVRGCQIYNNYALGVSLKHGATNGVVENCQIHSNSLLNFYLDGASKTQIRYNKIYDCSWDAGIKFGAETSTFDTDTIQVYYNLLWDNANGIAFTAASGVTGQVRNISIYNNTFYNSLAVIRWKPGVTNRYGGTNSIENNLLWTQATTNAAIRDETTGQQGIAQTTIAYNGFQQGAATDTIGANAQVMADPYFVNPSAYDFHRSGASSLTVDTGTGVGLTRDFDGELVPQGRAPDIGAYEAGGNSPATYTLAVSATNGTVARTPDQTSYNSGDTVTLQATPNTGYTFSGWAGDLTGTTNPVTLVMNANKTVTANFTAAPAPTTYALKITATDGTVAASPSKAFYTSGETVTLQATPNAGYTFSGWLGDLTGTTNPATLVMDGNKTIIANFTAIPATYTLAVSAANGTVFVSPSKTLYTSGETVTLQATPSTGYAFSGWSGDLTGTTNPATLVMNANKSVTANFVSTGGGNTVGNTTVFTGIDKDSHRRAVPCTARVAGQLESLSIYHEAGSGRVILAVYTDVAGKPGTRVGVSTTTKVSPTAGWQTVKLQRPVPVSAGQKIWLSWVFENNPGLRTAASTPGRAESSSTWSGKMPPYFGAATIADGIYSVYATYTSVSGSAQVASATNDTTTRTPGQTGNRSDEPATVQPTTEPAPGPAGSTSDVGTPQGADVISGPDQTPPELGECTPLPDSIQAAPDTLVTLRVRDAGQGVDAASVSIRVDGALVYTGDVESQRTASGVCYRSGTKADYTYTYQPQHGLGYSKEIAVAVEARDLAGNPMPVQTYSFATEMYSFGVSQPLCVNQLSLPQGRPATVSDRQGNLWVVWHAGNAGSRHVYAARIQPQAGSYCGIVQLSRGAGDHCNPTLAIDAAGILYAVWQENAGGAWDVYASTSADGRTWSVPKPLAETGNTQSQSIVNRINPVVAASRQVSGLVAAAWQEDRAGNQDIYVAGSTNGFQTATVSQVTSDPAAQTDPVIAVNGENAIVVLWTDARNGSTDIYGAASDSGPWTNVPVVNGVSNQSHPTVAAGSTGRTLYLAWGDDQTGNLDIFYAVSDGLPASPLTGENIVDDTAGADQRVPVLTAAADPERTDRVFVCWEDERNVASGGTTDLYFADVSAGSLRTNVLVDGEAMSGHQHESALGTDRWGYPYVVWVGDACGQERLYYAGATYADPVPLVQGRIPASTGGLIGTSPQKIRSLNDVSIAIPADACPFDLTIRGARICHPRLPAVQSPSQVQFGPGDLVFARPVTITIPYRLVGAGTVRVYWFDAVTGTFHDEDLTAVRNLRAARGLGALQFRTTHLAPFYLVSGDDPLLLPLAPGSPQAGRDSERDPSSR